jgi:hypothetical protein
MKPLIFTLIATAVLATALPAVAQTVPDAYGRRNALAAGAMMYAAQPNYAGNSIAEASPYKLFGYGAFVDYRMRRWLQIEGEARWMNFNKYENINESNYLVGIRDPLHTWGRYTPYAKVLIGWGSGDFLSGRAEDIAYGGGLDYRLNKKLSLRVDFEQQRWRTTPVLHPYVGGVGVVYKIF